MPGLINCFKSTAFISLLFCVLKSSSKMLVRFSDMINGDQHVFYSEPIMSSIECIKNVLTVDVLVEPSVFLCCHINIKYLSNLDNEIVF